MLVRLEVFTAIDRLGFQSGWGGLFKRNHVHSAAGGLYGVVQKTKHMFLSLFRDRYILDLDKYFLIRDDLLPWALRVALFQLQGRFLRGSGLVLGSWLGGSFFLGVDTSE